MHKPHTKILLNRNRTFGQAYTINSGDLVTYESGRDFNELVDLKRIA